MIAGKEWVLARSFVCSNRGAKYNSGASSLDYEEYVLHAMFKGVISHEFSFGRTD